jgi:hypothetical protein
VHDATAFYQLRSVPGIGQVLALVLLYEIQDIHRFPRVQDFVSYCRLVKCAKESDGKHYGYSGTKIGVLNAREPMDTAIVRRGGADDIGEFEARRTLPTHARGDGRGRGHDLRVRGFGEIEGRACGQDAPLGEMEVAGGGGEMAMAEQMLDRLQVTAGFEEVGGDGVAQRVDAALLADARPEFGQGVELLNDGDVDGVRAEAIGEQPGRSGPWRPCRA